MSEMLTEKYRPKTIADIVGQARAKKTVESWLRTDRIPRSVMIFGVTSSGKTTLGRIIARAVLCLDRKGGEACGECVSCKQFDRSPEGHPAFVEMNAASERGIGDMRELTKKLSHKPILSKRKVIVLDEAHMITGPGWQAMLKPLEEPPPHIVFIILTTNPEKIPDTISGRCAKVRLAPISVQDCTNLLIEVAKDIGLGKAGIEEKHLEQIAIATGSHPRNALHALDQVYTQVLAAKDAGDAVTDGMVNSFVEDVAVNDVRTAACAVGRKILLGKTGPALKMVEDYQSDADLLLGGLTEVMRQAMLLSSSPKLLDQAYARAMTGLELFSLTPSAVVTGETKRPNAHSVSARKAVLEAYACFTKLRIETSLYSVPVGEVLGEAVARASLTIHEFLKSVKE